ncbi:NTP transferase domain-containing protein [Verrucomicrobiaceae bacterium N1E253]|uniref:NTP transferase domain-containing protein n=1 Tax=Oceaniferula marina TaxID=2748318 RepID=A0A851GC48_9BACT|nr:NTP transferase domain-containing protein [Oceaniferula marina]NWK55163.1 NTP transferase domain-containing protein [Oceaniferula marina]
MKKRIGILITGRLKSTRLKLKALKEIQGRSMFSHMVDRLKLASRPDIIVLCTSDLSGDDRLADLAIEEGIEVYRGHPDDVLARLTGAAVKFDLDTVINCMADNPFSDPEIIDQLADYHIGANYDYTRTEGVPLGLFSYALERKALEKVCRIKDDIDTEIWGAYFTDTGCFNCGVMKVVDEQWNFPELRLTVDTAPDFDVVTRIFNALNVDGEDFSGPSIIRYSRAHPELMEINKGVEQKKGHSIKLKDVD